LAFVLLPLSFHLIPIHMCMLLLMPLYVELSL
jgi:hypothetical protein